MSSISYQVDKILKVIPRERRTFLFSATMTKKVGEYPRFALCDRPAGAATATNRAIHAVSFWFTGPETSEGSSERSCQVCSIHKILHSRQTAAVLYLHTIKV